MLSRNYTYTHVPSCKTGYCLIYDIQSTRRFKNRNRFYLPSTTTQSKTKERHNSREWLTNKTSIHSKLCKSWIIPEWKPSLAQELWTEDISVQLLSPADMLKPVKSRTFLFKTQNHLAHLSHLTRFFLVLPLVYLFLLSWLSCGSAQPQGKFNCFNAFF